MSTVFDVDSKLLFKSQKMPAMNSTQIPLPECGAFAHSGLAIFSHTELLLSVC
jgi:hypothetical protein